MVLKRCTSLGCVYSIPSPFLPSQKLIFRPKTCSTRFGKCFFSIHLELVGRHWYLVCSASFTNFSSLLANTIKGIFACWGIVCPPQIFHSLSSLALFQISYPVLLSFFSFPLVYINLYKAFMTFDSLLDESATLPFGSGLSKMSSKSF